MNINANIECYCEKLTNTFALIFKAWKEKPFNLTFEDNMSDVEIKADFKSTESFVKDMLSLMYDGRCDGIYFFWEDFLSHKLLSQALSDCEKFEIIFAKHLLKYFREGNFHDFQDLLSYLGKQKNGWGTDFLHYRGCEDV